LAISFEEAARRARLELFERDRVLRSWYGDLAPKRVALPSSVPDALFRAYDFEAYEFEVVQKIHTAGVFGFPVTKEPVIYGFAARETPRDALSAALDECIQRLGFLWGEPIPEASPHPAPTPSFHQEFYLCPENHEALRRWLRGEHASLFAGRFRMPALVDEPAVEALRPAWLSPELHVVRANPRGHVPLGFGAAHPLLDDEHPAGCTVHPIL
jgi:ribosomal protein S12 methylthiotransferase accessory factor YcaO